MDGRTAKDMTVAEILGEIQEQERICEACKSELRELYLSLDKATFNLRSARTRIEALRAEVARRSAV
jgi:hypothetical protein